VDTRNTPAQPCTFCGAGISDGAALCTECVAKACAALVAIPELETELQVTISRQDAISDDRPVQVRQGLVLAAADLDPRGRPWAGSLRPTRLPYAAEAAEVAAACRATLSTWCRLLAEELHPDAGVGTDLPENTVVAMAAYLENRSGWWRRQGWASDLADQLLGTWRALERAVDRREAQRYVGPCGAPLQDVHGAAGVSGVRACPVHLYAEPGADYVGCPSCGARYDVHARRRELLAAAEDRLAHVELLVGALSGLGVELNVERVRKWAQRGRLLQHGHDQLGRKLYRVGDAVDLAAEMAAGGRRGKARRAS